MLYNPVTGNQEAVSLIEAIHKGASSDGALYLPQSYPLIPKAYYKNIGDMSLPEIGYVVANMLFGTDIPSATIKDIIYETLTFDIPFRRTAENRYELDLTHGPTGNYNDVSARFMANLLKRYRKYARFNVIISSSTGAGHAVADAFHDMPGVKSYILFPAGSLSERRRNAITNYGENVVPVEVSGSLMKVLDITREAVTDPEMQAYVPIITANSVNVAALLPRTVVYLYAYSRLIRENKSCKNIVISIPTRNLGNVTAAIIASKMGLPVSRYVALRDDDRYAVNDSRIAVLLGEDVAKHEIFSPKTNPLRDDETEIRLITDNENNCIMDGYAASRQPITHISATYKQLKRVILKS